MEEKEISIFKSIDEKFLKDELIKFGIELNYISITKNLNISVDRMCLRIYCSNPKIYYIYLDGRSNFMSDERVNNLLINVLDDKNKYNYFKYLIDLEVKKIEYYDNKIISIKNNIKCFKKQIKEIHHQ